MRKKTKIIIAVVASVFVVLIGTLIIFFVVLGNILDKTFNRNEYNMKNAVKELNTIYDDELTFDRYVSRSDYDISLTSKKFFVTSANLDDAEIEVDLSDGMKDEYLSYYYRDDIEDYFLDLMEEYLPDEDMEVELYQSNWFCDSGDMDFDDYMEEMEGKSVAINIMNEDVTTDDLDAIIEEMRDDEIAYSIALRVYDGDKELCYGMYTPEGQLKPAKELG